MHHRPSRRRWVREILTVAAVAACSRDATAPSASPALTAGQPFAASDATAPIGIGGAFTMPASGNQVAPVTMQATGVRLPAGTPTEIKFEGQITRQFTPGVLEFCELTNIKPACTTAWRNILQETPLLPFGDNTFQNGAAKAVVSWDGGDAVSPDSGKSAALSGASGEELWAGRSGYVCWYSDSRSGLKGPCFTFGGAYTVTVVAKDGTSAGADGSAGPRLKLDIVRADVGPAGGSADLHLSVDTAIAVVAARAHSLSALAGEAPQIGLTKWYFIPDVSTSQEGTAPPAPFLVSGESATAANFASLPADATPQPIGRDQLRLPDGRVVSSTGVYVYSLPTRDAPPKVVGRAPAGRTRRPSEIRGASPVSSTAAGPIMSALAPGSIHYENCDGRTDCFVRFGAPEGTFLAVTTVDGTAMSASARVKAQAVKPVRITMAAGPNPGGSFTTRQGENFLTLRAETTPSSLASQVQWEVLDDPADQVASPATTVGSGDSVKATVGAVLNPSGRWPGHPGRMDEKAIRYRVRAYVTLNGLRTYSDPVVVGQSVEDVLRQEYVDFGSASSLIPTAAEFSHGLPTFRGIVQNSPSDESGLGDYCVTGGGSCTTLVRARLSSLITWLESRWRRDLRVNSVLRNPVHHHKHYPRSKNDSPHKYGTAVDYEAYGEDHSQAQKLYWSALRNTGLGYPEGVCAETWYLGGNWNGHHVHFDRRFPQQNPCPQTWKVPEDLTGQYLRSSIAATSDEDLLTQLRSADWEERGVAAATLAEMPVGALPTGYGAVAVDQLRSEVAWRLAKQDEPSEEYPAYLLDLVRVVHRSGDSTAVSALVHIGIETSLGLHRFIARYPALALPALESSWASENALHADVVAVYGEMLRAEADSGRTLSPDQHAAIDAGLLRAAGSDAIAQWGVAHWIGELGLVEYAPLVERLAAEPPSVNDPMGLVPSTASAMLPKLRARQAVTSTSTVVALLRRLQQSACVGRIGADAGQCVALEALLSTLARQLDASNAEPARATLSAYLKRLEDASARAIFSEPQILLLRGNAEALMARLSS